MLLSYKGCQYERKILQRNIKLLSDEHIRTVKYRGINYRLYQVPSLPGKLKYQVRYRGSYVRSESIDLSQELTFAAIQLQTILDRMQSNGIAADIAQAEVAKMMIEQARWNPTKKKELMAWGRALGAATVNNTIESIINRAIISVL